MLFKKPQSFCGRREISAFTLVELLVAVSVIAIGMVFVLGAFSRCLSSSNIAKKMIQASFLLTNKIWEIDLEHVKDKGSLQGRWEGVFETKNESFSWSQVVTDASARALGEEAYVIEDGFNAEIIAVGWDQARLARNLSISRYIKKGNQTV